MNPLAAVELRQVTNPRAFATAHYAALKQAQQRGGALVDGYQPLAHEPADLWIKDHALESDRVSLNMMTQESDYKKATYLSVDARLEPGLWEKRALSVSHVAGQGPLITEVVIPRWWSNGRWQVRQVHVPADPKLPPTYSKLTGPDFQYQEWKSGQEGYPRERVWALLDRAKELDPLLRVPGRTVGDLTHDYFRAMQGVAPPYWDGEPGSLKA